MKTTGVSRRIDDLGRIVIPKEIRKNLKIRDGELLEIFVEDDRIILTKNSVMRGVGDIAKLCIESLSDTMKSNMVITDRDKVIAVSAPLRKKYLEKDLSMEVSELLLKHNVVIEREPKVLKIDNDNEEYVSYISHPIIVDGDIAGSVIVLATSDKLTDFDERIAGIIANILSRNLMQ